MRRENLWSKQPNSLSRKNLSGNNAGKNQLNAGYRSKPKGNAIDGGRDNWN